MNPPTWENGRQLEADSRTILPQIITLDRRQPIIGMVTSQAMPLIRNRTICQRQSRANPPALTDSIDASTRFHPYQPTSRVPNSNPAIASRSESLRRRCNV